MLNKRLNIFLLSLIMLLLVSIINEFIYDRFNRFEYTIDVNKDYNNDSARIRIISSYVTIDDNESFEIYPYELGFMKKEKLPKKIKIKWYDYRVDKFYIFDGDLPYKELKDAMRKTDKDFRTINFMLGNRNQILVSVGTNTVKKLFAKETTNEWFKNENKEKVLFFTNEPPRCTTYLELESDSKFIEAYFYNSAEYSNYAARERYFSDSIVNGKILFEDSKLDKSKSYDFIEMVLKNPKFNDDNFNKKLKIKINLDSDEIYDFTKNSNKQNIIYYLKFDRSDSLKNVIISNGKETRSLKKSVKFGF